MVKNSKDKFYREQLLTYKSDQTKFWQIVNNLLGKKSTQRIGQIFRPGGTDLCGEQESVEIISYFAEIGEKIMENMLDAEHIRLDERSKVTKGEFNLLTVDKFLEIVGELCYILVNNFIWKAVILRS